jgi:pimeloyl-ACP methyl ester carboxylesterase
MAATRTVTLADGRRLVVATYGPQSGHPVLYLHGTPSAHGEWEVFGSDALLEQSGLRVVAPDRPGMGGSTFKPRRRIGDWPADASALADALGIGRFSVLGYSGGGAYAIATALLLPERVAALALVAPVVHATAAMSEGLDRGSLRIKEMARERPRLARLLLTLTMALPSRHAPALLFRQMRRTLPPIDWQAISHGDRLQRFVSVLRDAFRHGGAGAQRDMALMSSPWDFPLTAAQMPVQIWQGEFDNIGARPAMARYLGEALEATAVHILPEGHISILTTHLQEILRSLVPVRR